MTPAQHVYSAIVTPFSLETGEQVCWKESHREMCYWIPNKIANALPPLVVQFFLWHLLIFLQILTIQFTS